MTTPKNPPKHKKPIDKTLIELAKHILLTTLAFLMIFGVAIGLDWLIRVLEEHGYVKSQTPILWALYGAKYIILAADSTLLIVLVIKLTWREIQRKL